MRNRLVGVLAIASAAVVGAQQTATPSQHHADMNRRGAQFMGFDQEKTVHHFYLYEDGGSIDVAVKAATDKTNLDAIRSHLPHIAMMFGQGHFDTPMQVHDTQVPGTMELAKLKDRLTYTYVETPLGGRVDVVTSEAGALAALHKFLRFQIADHQTGDTTAIRRR
jgi:hypothetical protein